MASGRCAAPGCGRFVRRGATWCPRHWGELTEVEREAFVGRPDVVDAVAAEFRRRLAEGDYRALFGETLRAVIRQAADEAGLADEIGILRIVLARLLLEERDPAQLATSVSRVAGVAIQAARTQRAIGGVAGESITEAVTTILAELGEG